MRRIAALLAAVLVAAPLAGCGGDGAEPGAPRGATLVLDFTPNPVHAGIYAALAHGFYEDNGIELAVQAPGASSDAPKLLAAGRADFAILDIHDLGIARERGLDLVGVAPIVQRPLASVIARADGPVRQPRDLENRLAGVTGLPSDDAVLESVVEGNGGNPNSVERVTIGFNAVSSLAAGKVDAATGFWNAEAVALRRLGVPIRVFKVDRYGAPVYPELILTTSARALREDPELVGDLTRATERGYRIVVRRPTAGLDALLASNPELDRAEQRAQLDVVLPALRPPAKLPGASRRFDSTTIVEWLKWDIQHGILEGDRPRFVEDGFYFGQLP